MEFTDLILHEDNHLLLVNKPPGILTQGDATGDAPLGELAQAYIRAKYDKPGNVFIGVVHRLDRPVSGVVALAKTSKALERLTTAFRTRAVEKVYWALVARRPVPENGTLIHWLTKDERRNVVSAHSHEVPGSQRAELAYEVLRAAGPYWLVEVRPLTGRPHQIRVQFAAGLRAPIAGDVKYGAAQPLPNPRQIGLHARRLTVPHPTKPGETVTVEAPVPVGPPWALVKRLVAK
ncbi:MAG: RNA pseudouridine synthase [Hymenobacteraceae bacterium]|nr:RNA pseudouridine synthase [Hymenobacteraceae bacterium]